ncbi:alginate export family protein [Parasediminibacterium sp. JCM 36343]|uniref:alginate export family protein n=1 Tax=Parasediminibacterium sp. JCM 36343 TaxID=3374279 RepID=UPI00397A1724
MLTKNIPKIFLAVGILTGLNTAVSAQISLTGQLRTRTELRDGIGNLVLKGAPKAAFTSQRTRLNFGYKWDRLTVGVTLQDIRVWGQDASTITANDGAKLMLHEAWADVVLANKADTSFKFRLLDMLSLKVGRQELIYDDSRLLGNLDWLQQGRRHDMALLKAVHHGWQVDLGYAFNQNTDAVGYTGTGYAPGNVPTYAKSSTGVLMPVPGTGFVPIAAAGNAANNSSRGGTAIYTNPPSTNAATADYKSFTSLYISKKFNQTKFSALLFNDNFGKSKLDSIADNAGGYLYGKRYASAGAADTYDYSGYNSRFTYGLMVNQAIGGASSFAKVALQAAYYQQSGKDRAGLSLNAYHYMLQAAIQKGNFTITPGFEVLSGNDSTTAATDSKRFDPLYGTAHKFRGNMDYFYAGANSPAGGLTDIYFKVKYATALLSLSADYHNFATQQQMKATTSKQLGNEVDLQLGYQLNKFTNAEFGYSFMLANDNMTVAKGQTAAISTLYNKTATWFYVILKFTPDFMYTKAAAKAKG